MDAGALAGRQGAPQGGQRLQRQPQVLLPLVSVEGEEEAGGPFGEQRVQALGIARRLVKGASVEGRVEDVRLDSCKTAKGLPEDTRREVAVYQNL